MIEEVHPASDTLAAKNTTGNVADKLWLQGTPPISRYIGIMDLAALARQSLQRNTVIGKVLIVGRL